MAYMHKGLKAIATILSKCIMSSASPLTMFVNMLVRFFQELIDTFPEERDIKLALETIQGARKINPGLVRDMFYEHVTKDLKEAISKEDEQYIIMYGRSKISQQFNEILPALAIFDKHWNTLSEANHTVIWNYLKVLITLNEKARSASTLF
jgi:GTP1/Obg family GTP-binding protein